MRPKATLGEYKGLEVAKRDAGGPRQRRRRGARPAARARGQARDRRPPGPARRLRGDGLRGLGRRHAVRRRRGPRPDDRARLRPARARASRSSSRARSAARSAPSRSRSPTTTARPSWPARRREFAVTVREVKAKQLPELNDEFAEEAGFDTLDELREDIRTRMAEEETSRIEAEFREAALDAAVADATLEVPDALVEARAREMWESMLHSLSHQGINRETYLRHLRPLRGGDDRVGQAGRRAGAAPRGGAGRGGRGRVARADRGGDARGRRRGGAARREASRPRSCWSGCGPTAAWTASRTTSSQRKALDLRRGVGQAGSGHRQPEA